MERPVSSEKITGILHFFQSFPEQKEKVVQVASTTSHSDIRGLSRISSGQSRHGCAPSGDNAVYRIANPEDCCLPVARGERIFLRAVPAPTSFTFLIAGNLKFAAFGSFSDSHPTNSFPLSQCGICSGNSSFNRYRVSQIKPTNSRATATTVLF